MRTRRFITAIVLTVTLTTTLSAATRDANPGARVDRPSIVAKVKRTLTSIIKAFNQPTVPIPAPTNP